MLAPVVLAVFLNWAFSWALFSIVSTNKIIGTITNVVSLLFGFFLYLTASLSIFLLNLYQ